MESVVSMGGIVRADQAVYPKPGNGRPPVGIDRMLQWFNLSDPAVEEALYDPQTMQRFVGIDRGREPMPDETTVCRFRHLLETRDLGRRLFDEVQRHLAAKGLKVATGTIVDATIINAPYSLFDAIRRKCDIGRVTFSGTTALGSASSHRLTANLPRRLGLEGDTVKPLRSR